ncbi:MAG: hypothetical protein CSA86_06015 [Arcobacter sp.]|nr:MAG: hypothetical protein CSA86_06015 [Arcobacter sp.]
MNSKSSKKKQDTISLEDSIVSSCDCANPDWSIRVSSASYDTKDEWLHTFNPRLYIGSVPILYSPYFGFPTNTKRRTGLLLPTLGYSNTDGLYYSQSVFYAPAQNYDFEFIPQIRNKRGYGVYTYFRYADSPYSLLKIQTGGFKEKKYYQEREKLKNQKHYGWNVDYSRTKLFSKKENHQDGLYASINYMNDVEYKTLENDKDISIDKNVESKINYFYNTPKYYGGVYAKYYIDTSRNSNDNVLQELPQIHLHKYYDSIFTSNIMYS